MPNAIVVLSEIWLMLDPHTRFVPQPILLCMQTARLYSLTDNYIHNLCVSLNGTER
jgi:hypothetical protein